VQYCRLPTLFREEPGFLCFSDGRWAAGWHDAAQWHAWWLAVCSMTGYSGWRSWRMASGAGQWFRPLGYRRAASGRRAAGDGHSGVTAPGCASAGRPQHHEKLTVSTESQF